MREEYNAGSAMDRVTLSLQDAFDRYMQATFHERTLEEVAPLFSPLLAGFGTGADEIAFHNQNLFELYQRDFSQAPFPLAVSNLEKQVQLLSETTGVVMAVFDIAAEIEGQPFVMEGLRLSTVFHRQGEAWLLAHMHISLPTGRQEEGESYPLQELREQNRRLEEKVAQQTAVLREQERRLATLLGNLPGMAYRCSLNQNWTMLYVSDGCRDLTGYESDELKNNRVIAFADLILPEDRKMVWEAVTTAVADQLPYQLNYRIQTKSGDLCWVWEQGQAVRDAVSDELLLEGFIQDVTALKDVELRLQKTADELARSNKDYQQFAYAVSHDLQEPLRMISAYLQLLEGELDAKLDENSRQYLNFAVDGAQRMHGLIRGLLEFSRVGTSPPEDVPVPVGDILSSVLQSLQMALREAGVTVEADPLPTVYGDAAQMHSLLQNLLSNGIKYRRKTDPAIQIRYKRQPDAHQFAVIDNGIGIPANQQERIFQIFQRLHTRDEIPGAGLGLALCKRIVERHDGRIWVESTPGEGSAFYFTLPRTP